MKNLTLALLAVLASVVAPAVEAQPESAYYGLSLGNFEYQENDFSGNALIDDKVSSYRLMVGYQFMEHLAVEGGYGKTGTIRDEFAVPVFPSGTAAIGFASEFKILTIRLLGVLPFDNGIALMGGLAYADLKQDIDFTVDGTPAGSQGISGNEPAYYIAAQYNLDRFAVRLGYEQYDFEGDTDVSETSISFFYKL